MTRFKERLAHPRAAAFTLLFAVAACGTESSDTLELGELANTSASSPAERSPGYLLISPLKDTSAYLLDENDQVVHQWDTDHNPGNSVYFLDDGDLLRCVREGNNPIFHGGGEGGRLQRYSWEGELEWDLLWSDETRLSHHDVQPMPNGNVLLLTWTLKTREEALAAGMDPALIQGDEIWPDSVVEVRPIEPDGYETVWTWNLWDHLVQEFDPKRDNYGVVEEHPERVDVNAHRHREQKSEDEQKAELAHMAAIGYAGDIEPEEPADAEDDTSRTPANHGRGGGEDFCHTNGIDYNPELDQIVLSVRTFNELWVIDHSTTTEEAAGRTGGRWGKGGDLLYRWGNPINYGRGTSDHQQLFVQHDARWVPAGMPGAGNITIFNNGTDRMDGDYSSVVEITPPMNSDGSYRMEDGEPFGPHTPTWEYVAKNPADFYSSFISGAERQPNGNTLICSGEQGLIFEVDRAGNLVWEFMNPFGEADERGRGRGRGPRGDGGRGPRGPGGSDGQGGPPPPGAAGHRPPPGGGPPNGARGGGPGDGGPHDGGVPPGAGGPPDHDGAMPEGGAPPGGAPNGAPPGGGKRRMNPKALFRASRIAPDHPGLKKL